jgi:dTDP-4-dehydrorhamnose 3,5-epimerase
MVDGGVTVSEAHLLGVCFEQTDDKRTMAGALQFNRTPIPGCFEVWPAIFTDERGSFAKPFHEPSFGAQGIAFTPVESFYTASRAGVIRGFHLQLPPHSHDKLVYCASGAVMDVVVDLRIGSPAEGLPFSMELDANKSNALFIPAGVAHAFYSRTDGAVLSYLVSTPHEPGSDAGVRWNSVGIEWPEHDPIVSERDRLLPPISEFKSPFVFE